jgi:hypothetical protein
MNKRNNRIAKSTITLTMGAAVAVAAILAINELAADPSFSGPMLKVYAEENEDVQLREHGNLTPSRPLPQSPAASTVDGQSNNNNYNNLGIVNNERAGRNDNERTENNRGENSINSNIFASLVLLGTIAVITAVGGYAGYKLLSIKRQRSLQLKRNNAINSTTTTTTTESNLNNNR